MFINYYFPLRAPGGLLAEVYRLSTVYYNFSNTLLTLTIFIRADIIRGENTYKKYHYFYFLREGIIFILPIPSTCVHVYNNYKVWIDRIELLCSMLNTNVLRIFLIRYS